MAVTVRPLTDAVGVEVIGVDLKAMNEPEFAAVERAWHEYSVILLRGQSLGDDDLLSFSRRFGELDPRDSLRIVMPSATALIMSFQMIFASLFVSILAIRRRSHPPVTDPAEEAADVVDAAVVRVAGEAKTLKLKDVETGATADEHEDARDEDKDPAETS